MSYQTRLLELMHDVFVEDLQLPEADFQAATPGVEVPKKKEMGDFAYACFKFAKALRKNPAAIAQDALVQVQRRLNDYPEFASVTAAGPYLNFSVDQAALAKSIVPGILNGTYLAQRPAKGVKVMIEYSQPNTHKAFHVGHMRNVALGDALTRICEWNGYDVTPVNYIGDEGAHIAKCLWYFRNHFEGEVPTTNRGEFLGVLYTAATEMLDPSTLTAYPIPGVLAAQVVKIDIHPQRDDQTIVTLDLGEREAVVVCGGTGFSVGDKVAFAGPRHPHQRSFGYPDRKGRCT